MLWNDVRPEIHKRKAHINNLVNKWPSGCMELVPQYFVGLGQSDHPLHMDPLGGNDPIPDHSLCWQLVDPSHGGWCINLDITGGEQILNLKEVMSHEC